MKSVLFFALFFSLIASAGQSENLMITPTTANKKTQVAVMGRASSNIGLTFVNSLNTVTFKITNTGDEALTYRQAVIYGIPFGARHNCTAGLLPNESCNVRIEFWPHQEGYFSGQFQLRFNEDSVVIDLWGNARR